MKPIRTYVIDDHPLVLDAMRSRFAGVPDVDLIGSAQTVPLGIEEAKKLRPDVIILDLRVDGMRGVPTLSEFKPHCRGIILFTSRIRDGLVEQLLAAGAFAHVAKTAELSALDEAILAASKCEFGVSEAAPATKPIPRPHEELSPREAEVYRLLAACRTPKQIAFDLGVAPSTVYTHIDRVVSKLNLDSPAEVVRYALEFDLNAG